MSTAKNYILLLIFVLAAHFLIKNMLLHQQAHPLPQPAHVAAEPRVAATAEAFAQRIVPQNSNEENLSSL